MTHPAARDLTEALARMTWDEEPGEFALVGFAAAPTEEDLALLGQPPAQVIREADETSLLVRLEHVDAVLARHTGGRVEGPLVWIRFDAPMGWEVVGFLARVTAALAAADVPVGAVCGFSRDHLFLNREHRERALGVLTEMFPRR